MVIIKEAKLDHQDRIVENEGYYESAIGIANGASNLYALRLYQNHQPNFLLHHGGRFESNDLRLG